MGRGQKWEVSEYWHEADTQKQVKLWERDACNQLPQSFEQQSGKPW